jgi:hypothetical protein
MNFKHFLLIPQRLLLFACLFLLSFCQQAMETDPQTGQELLQRTLEYHDPKGNWQEFKARLYLSSADTAGKEHTYEIEIDNTTGYFAHISRRDGKEIVKGMAGGKAFYLLDGKQEISQEDREKYDLTPKSVNGVHTFYGYLYGLPMKLTDEGAIISEAIRDEELEGKSYRVLQVNYAEGVGKDNWFFYLDPDTYAMQAYRFNYGNPESGEYILLEQEETVQGIKLPKVRKWYWNKSNAYIGTDTLLKAEKLDAYRI